MPSLKSIFADHLFIRTLMVFLFLLSMAAIFADSHAQDHTQHDNALPPQINLNLPDTRNKTVKRAATTYHIYGGRNWSAPELENRFLLNGSEFFSKVSLGVYHFPEELQALHRLTFGWRDPSLEIALSSEKNSLTALLPYVLDKSEYYGGALRLTVWTDAQKNITFSNRAVIASVFAPKVYEKNQLVLMNTFAQKFNIIDAPAIALELESSLDFLLDLERIGNKLGFRLQLPFFYNIEESFKGQLQLNLAHTQLSTRQVENRILDAYIYQISDEHFATNLLSLKKELRFYPFQQDFLDGFFFGVSALVGVYHLDPDPIEALYLNYQLGLASGWGSFEEGFLGLQMYYDMLNSWQIAFYASQSW